MNEHNLEVLINVIGAVESGGQVYGKRNYASYSPPYHSTPKEHTITIGWACCYGHEAQQLIQAIKDADLVNFFRLDSADIDNMLLHNWEALHWKPNTREKAAIIALIDSPTGHKVQDAMFAEKMEKLIDDCKRDYPGADVYAQMMYCEIRHLGGRGPVNRIFDRCQGDYSLDNIMAALVTDQRDTSSDNQVGDKRFWSRHVKCKQFIEEYAEPETPAEEKGMTITQAINAVIATAEAEIGYKEKASPKDLYDKEKNAGSGNYTKYNKELHDLQPSNMDYPAAWCDAFVDFCFYKTFGAALAREMLCGNFDDYTVQSAQYYKNRGRWTTTPARGHQIFFKNSQRICHTGLVKEVSGGRVYTIEGNANNAVRAKSYDINDDYIAGYGRPIYELAASIMPEGDEDREPYPDSLRETIAKYQEFLNTYYRDLIQPVSGILTVDGEFGKKTRAASLAVWKYMANKYYNAGLTVGNDNFLSASKAAAEKMTDAEVKKHATLAEIRNALLAAKGFRTVSEFRKAKGISTPGDTWYALFN